jgi:hypothetical protein
MWKASTIAFFIPEFRGTLIAAARINPDGGHGTLTVSCGKQ